MRTLSSVLALVAVLMLAGAAYAEDGGGANKAPKPKSLKGEVVRVDGANVIIKVGKGAEAKEVTVATDANTQVVIDGVAAKVGDLKAGQKVAVMPETGTATKIVVAAQKAAGEGAKKKKGAE